MCAWTQSRPGTLPAAATLADSSGTRLAPFRLDDRHAEALRRTVETEIIPRLMLLHRAAQVQPAEARGADLLADVEEDEVEAFTLSLLESHDAALDAVRACAQRGVPTAALCLHLLAPAARRLGEKWTADECDFAQVTIGLGRLQGLLRGVAKGLPSYRGPGLPVHSALFAPAPGEQHTLGLAMVREFFRASGWEVCDDVPDAPASLLALVRSRRFQLVGFSIGAERHLDALAALIDSVRKASADRHLIVLGGGPLLLSRPDLSARLGLDATAADAREAIDAAETLLKAQGKGW